MCPMSPNVTPGSRHTSQTSHDHDDKENDSLPMIDYTQPCSPEDVVNRNQSLLMKSKLRTLAKKLAHLAYFGPDILEKCTV